MIDNKYKELKDLSSGSYGKVGKGAIVDRNTDEEYDPESSPKAAVKVYVK